MCIQYIRITVKRIILGISSASSTPLCINLRISTMSLSYLNENKLYTCPEMMMIFFRQNLRLENLIDKYQALKFNIMYDI